MTASCRSPSPDVCSKHADTPLAGHAHPRCVIAPSPPCARPLHPGLWACSLLLSHQPAFPPLPGPASQSAPGTGAPLQCCGLHDLSLLAAQVSPMTASIRHAAHVLSSGCLAIGHLQLQRLLAQRCTEQMLLTCLQRTAAVHQGECTAKQMGGLQQQGRSAFRLAQPCAACS